VAVIVSEPDAVADDANAVIDPVAQLWARLAGVLDEIGALDPAGVSDEQLACSLHERERAQRRLVGVDHHLLPELADRIAIGRMPARSAREYLVRALRVSPLEAGRRVRAAGVLGPRRALSGETLPPLLAGAAAAQDVGVISGTIPR
jgi:hypothetical protein